MPIYAKFPFPGECEDTNHEQHVTVSGMSWGVSQPSGLLTARKSGPQTARFPECEPLRLSRQPDKASAELMIRCIESKEPMKEVVIEVCGANDSKTPVVRFKLKDVFITEVDQQFDERGMMTESISLVFAESSWEFLSKAGTPATSGWNWKGGKKIS